LEKIRKVRTPGNRISIHKKRAKVGIKLCANCKKPLHGIPRLTPSELNKLSKTKKGVNRVFGGYLCSNCTKEVLREKTYSL
jgi:large subunit ribosomal protein L34e